jgi:hypothetical protein
MKLKIAVAISLIAVISASVIPGGCLNTVYPELNLPKSQILIDVFSGTDSFFNVSLSGILDGYDVTNGSYRAWCVDRRYGRPYFPFQAYLYSSCDPPPIDQPIDLANQRWDMVNYVLNHKQGIAADVQQAIWYFVNFRSDYNYTPTRPTAIAIVEDAKQNGTGFIPHIGQIIAVIIYPVSFIQLSVIEVFLKSPLPGDINNDGIVDVLDAIALATAYHARKGDPNWNPTADLNNDGVIDIFDAIILANNFGKSVL